MDEGFGKLLKQFYVKLPGSKRSITVGAEVPIEYHRWMDELAASKDYPEYKTRSDILRDCIHLGLSLRTDPRFRDSPELHAVRSGIQALDTFAKIEQHRQMLDELVFSLRQVNPTSKAGAEILANAEAYLPSVDDENDRLRLSQSIEAFRSRI